MAANSSDSLQGIRRALEGRYAIQGELGRGGMATVYLADDLKHERRVALKVLNPELTASVGAARFLREIRIAAQLQHPNILPLIDSGEVDGSLFYVMPFVEGETLQARLAREGSLPPVVTTWPETALGFHTARAGAVRITSRWRR